MGEQRSFPSRIGQNTRRARQAAGRLYQETFAGQQAFCDLIPEKAEAMQQDMNLAILRVIRAK